MLLNRMSPLRLLEEMRTPFELFEETVAGRPMFAPAGFPAVNAWADDDKFYVEAEIPGLALNDLELFVVDGNVLHIKGQRPECKCAGGTWLRRERGYGSFERQVPLPGPVDAEQIEAVLQNGVLTITLPKAPEIKPRRIEVKAS